MSDAANSDTASSDTEGSDTEKDVPVDDATASSRDTGGDEDATGPDHEGTTGTGESEEFVGRVSGQDEGYAGMTGAEARAMPDSDEGSGAANEQSTGSAPVEPPD